MNENLYVGAPVTFHFTVMGQGTTLKEGLKLQRIFYPIPGTDLQKRWSFSNYRVASSVAKTSKRRQSEAQDTLLHNLR